MGANVEIRVVGNQTFAYRHDYGLAAMTCLSSGEISKIGVSLDHTAVYKQQNSQ